MHNMLICDSPSLRLNYYYLLIKPVWFAVLIWWCHFPKDVLDRFDEDYMQFYLGGSIRAIQLVRMFGTGIDTFFLEEWNHSLIQFLLYMGLFIRWYTTVNRVGQYEQQMFCHLLIGCSLFELGVSKDYVGPGLDFNYIFEAIYKFDSC